MYHESLFVMCCHVMELFFFFWMYHESLFVMCCHVMELFFFFLDVS